MNECLKEIADLCGITKHLTRYVARRTLATTVAVANNVRIKNLSAMMGHTSIKQTQYLCKRFRCDVKEDMDN